MKICATGDSLFLSKMPQEYDADFKSVTEYISKADVKITNLETNVSKFGDFANQYSGGTWLNVEPEVFEDLTKFGFDYYGTANNHCMDYSYHGLLSTIAELDKRGLLHSGTGKDLKEASRPAIMSKDGKKIAIFAFDTSHQAPSKAGYETKSLKGRPGVNYLDSETYYPIGKEDFLHLREIAEKSAVNVKRNLSIKGGFQLSDPEGVFDFGGVKFCYDGSKKRTECNKKDKERILNDIKSAKQICDYVVVLIHCHGIGVLGHEDVPEYFEEIARASIDAGACAIIGSGTHQLKPIEIYKGCPIFYSLGDFIYQGMSVPVLPADFMVKYGVDIDSTAHAGLMARSKNGKIGLQTEKCNFLSVIPFMEFSDEGKLIKLELMPISLGFEKPGALFGLPSLAKSSDATEIFNTLVRLSNPYGTRLYLDDGMIKVEI